MNERREREAYARWEKGQWVDGKVARKVRDRPKAARPPAHQALPDLPPHPTEGGHDEVLRALGRAEAAARRRGKDRVARKRRGWR